MLCAAKKGTDACQGDSGGENLKIKLLGREEL